MRALARVAALCLPALVACSAGRQAPFDVVQSYHSALRESRYSDAYSLLSSDARRTLSYDDFERVARDNPDEVRETVRWLEQVDPNAPVTARLDLGNGENVQLVEEGGGWRLDPAVLDFYGQRSPRQCVRSFTRALDRRRWDVLVRFAPRRVAESLTADQLRDAWERGGDADDVQRMLTALRQSTERPIEVSGDRATMTYGVGNRFTMQLVREDGVWKVEDPD
jgi:hypothetical protein